MQWWCSAQGTPWVWEWRAYPGVWIVTLAVAMGYWSMVRSDGRFAQHSAAGSSRRAAGWAGVFCVWAALDWPIGPLAAGYLASVHAVQFLLIAMIGVPLMLYGAAPAIRARHAAGGSARWPLIGAVSGPLMAAVIFNIATIITHMPSVVDTLMVSQLGAFVVDTAWLVSSAIFWWPVMVGVPERLSLRPPVQMLYVFVGTLFHTAIGMVMLLTEFPLYGVYELAPPMTGLSAMDDLRIAGGVMEFVGTLIVLGIVGAIFFRWAGEDARDARVAAHAG